MPLETIIIKNYFKWRRKLKEIKPESMRYTLRTANAATRLLCYSANDKTCGKNLDFFSTVKN